MSDVDISKLRPDTEPEEPLPYCYPKELRDKENGLIRNRRREAGVPPERLRVGLALSGGGIRSATFCLGVLQALAEPHLLRKVDFLSTVSGGGYTGSFLGRMFTRDWIKGEKPREKGSERWPEDIKKALAIDGIPADRIESLIDNHRSTPMKWLRESGRYLAPTGPGDLVSAVAVAFRNWISVLMVVATSLLAVFLFVSALRAGLWHLQWWSKGVEDRLMRATLDEHWWWSPLLILPAVVFVFVTLPLGWSYWLTQKDTGAKWHNLSPSATTVVVIGMSIVVACLDRVSYKYEHKITFCIAVIVGIGGFCALIYYFGARYKAKLDIDKAEKSIRQTGPDQNGLGKTLQQLTLMRSVIVAIGAVCTLVIYSVGIKPSTEQTESAQDRFKENQQQVTITRNYLSKWYSAALVTTVVLLIAAVVDSFGQMAYALLRPDHGPGLKGLLTVTGLIAFFGVAMRAKLLVDQLPGQKKFQIPLSILAGILAAVVAGALLISVSGVASGFAWEWKNPYSIISETNPPTNPQVVRLPALISTNYNTNLGTTNYTFTNFPAIALAGKIGDKSNVALTKDELIQVVEPSSTISTSPSASEMSVQWAVGAFVVFLVLTFCFGHILTFLNLSSHETLYASRICRAYQGASNPDRWYGPGQIMDDALPTDDQSWRRYRPYDAGGPLHIVNVTLNETIGGKSQIESVDRKGLIVAVGPAGITVGARFHALWKDKAKDDGLVDFVEPLIYASSQETDRSPTIEPKSDAAQCYHPLYSGDEDKQEVERLSLRRWIAISGAAITTGLGKGTSKWKSLLLGLANIRLGYWWDCHITPRDRRKINRGSDDGDYVEGNIFRTVGSWLACAFPVQAHLYDEFLAKFRGPNSRLWYLSDGAHFENTAGYELIRRRVPFIILCDCGCDRNYEFEDLGQLVRMVRIDFGAEIEFLTSKDLDDLRLGKDERAIFGEPGDFKSKSEKLDEKNNGVTDDAPKSQTRPYALLAQIWYPDKNGDPRKGGNSLLLVLKPGVSGDEPLDVVQYQSAHPDFPQEGTADQFFNEAQWESYRKLGRHIGEAVFKSSICDFMKEAQQERFGG